MFSTVVTRKIYRQFHDRNSTVIAIPLTRTIGNDQFLRFESRPDEHCILVFSSSQQVEILVETEEILVERIFRILSAIFVNRTKYVIFTEMLYCSPTSNTTLSKK